jgi:hypothetical protein
MEDAKDLDMTDPMKHADYVKAITEVAGVLYWLATHEPQPPERRGVLRRLRAILDAFLGPEPEPEEPPEMPPRKVEFFVQCSNGEDTWVHPPGSFKSEVEARHWARETNCKWNRIQRVETSYTLVEQLKEE